MHRGLKGRGERGRKREGGRGSSRRAGGIKKFWYRKGGGGGREREREGKEGRGERGSRGRKKQKGKSSRKASRGKKREKGAFFPSPQSSPSFFLPSSCGRESLVNCVVGAFGEEEEEDTHTNLVGKKRICREGEKSLPRRMRRWREEK